MSVIDGLSQQPDKFKHSERITVIYKNQKWRPESTAPWAWWIGVFTVALFLITCSLNMASLAGQEVGLPESENKSDSGRGEIAYSLSDVLKGESAGFGSQLSDSLDPSDEDLVKAVVKALEAKRVAGALSGFAVDVQCNRGVIQLTGIASSAVQRTMLIDIARKVPGVFAVYESIGVLSSLQIKELGFRQREDSVAAKAKLQSTTTDDESSAAVPSTNRQKGREVSVDSVLAAEDSGLSSIPVATGQALAREGIASANAGEVSHRKKTTGWGLPLPMPNVEQDTRRSSNSNLLGQLKDKLGEAQQEISAKPTPPQLPANTANRNYQNLLKIIAAGETGQSKENDANRQDVPAAQLMDPQELALPRIKRKPHRQAKAIPNTELIPIDAMILRGGVPKISWAGNRTYPSGIRDTEGQRIAALPVWNALIGPQQLQGQSGSTEPDVPTRKPETEQDLPAPKQGADAIPSLLLLPSTAPSSKPPSLEVDQGAALPNPQATASPNAFAPLAAPDPPPPVEQLPAGPVPTPALLPKQSPPLPVGLPSDGIQSPTLLNPAQPAPNTGGAAEPLSIESIPAPSGTSIEGSGVVPFSGYGTFSQPVQTASHRSKKHRLFRGICDGVCGCFCQKALSFGTEGTYLAPIGEGIATMEVTDLMTDAVQDSESVAGFAAGQRFWAQLQSNNVGIAAEYWFLSNRILDFSDYYIPPGDFGFQNNYLLDLNVFDLEYFQKFCCCGATFRASIGARYFELDRVTTIYGSGKTGGVLLSGSSRSSYESEGFGATMAVAGRFPLRCWGCHDNGTGWHLFWQLRGSVLDTEAILQARTEINAVPANGSSTVANSVDETHASWEGATSNGMLQTGLSYQWLIPQCNAISNFYIGFEGHLWQTAPVGLQTYSEGFIEQTGTDPFGASILASAETNPKDFAFAGFVWGFALYH